MVWLTDCATGDRLCEYVLDATGNQWLAGAANWLIAKPLAVAGLFVAGLVGRFLVHKVIDRLARRAAAGMIPDHMVSGGLARIRGEEDAAERAAQAAEVAARRMQRAETMASVLKSMASFFIFAVVVIMAVAELGYDVGPLIAGAGVIGLALGFGAQSLVKDFLSGMFMAFEDQLGVGDRVDINDVTGVVEAVTLRVTRVRADDGTVWYLRNGEILKVGNQSQR